LLYTLFIQFILSMAIIKEKFIKRGKNKGGDPKQYPISEIILEQS
jgi:hypothetical protein